MTFVDQNSIYAAMEVYWLKYNFGLLWLFGCSATLYFHFSTFLKQIVFFYSLTFIWFIDLLVTLQVTCCVRAKVARVFTLINLMANLKKKKKKKKKIKVVDNWSHIYWQKITFDAWVQLISDTLRRLLGTFTTRFAVATIQFMTIWNLFFFIYISLFIYAKDG